MDQNIQADIQQLEQDINSHYQKAEADYTDEKINTYKPIVENYLKQLDVMIDGDTNIPKQRKAKLLLLKGKVLDILPEYSKSGEESLSKSLKLYPLDPDCWNTLGNLLWKKKDYIGAKKCYEGAIDQCGKNKKSLRALSMVMRCLGEGQERKDNVQQSVLQAKEAVTLDLKDGDSWYILGNAYLSNFFVNMKKIDELQLSLKAYNQSLNFLQTKNPDLHYNRATINNYLEDYQAAIDDYIIANQLDKSLKGDEKIQQIQQKTTQLFQLIENKGRIKQKKLVNMIKSIPTALKTQPKNLGNINYQIQSLESLKEGSNRGIILTCKITATISQKQDVPAQFVFVDFKTDFGCISVYNTSNEIYDQLKENADVYIVDPIVKTIQLKSFGQENQNVNYKCIQIFEVDKLFVDSAQVNSTFSPNTIVNETFQK